MNKDLELLRALIEEYDSEKDFCKAFNINPTGLLLIQNGNLPLPINLKRAVTLSYEKVRPYADINNLYEV